MATLIGTLVTGPGLPPGAIPYTWSAPGPARRSGIVPVQLPHLPVVTVTGAVAPTWYT
jgi:hypothetical protein